MQTDPCIEKRNQRLPSVLSLVHWNAMHWYKFNIGDYRRDTVHLTTLEHGIYRQLLDWYYLEETPIPAETKAVMRRLCLGSDSVISLENVLRDFFVLGEKGYEQKRVNAEIATYKANAEQYAANGKLGGRPRKTKAVLKNNQSITKTKANPVTHKPINPITKEFNPPDWINRQHWDAWHSCPKKKKSTDSQKQMAVDKLAKWRDEGLDHAGALENSAVGGYQGLFLPDKPKHNGHSPAETPYQRSMRERVAEFSPGIARKNPNEVSSVITLESH